MKKVNPTYAKAWLLTAFLLGSSWAVSAQTLTHRYSFQDTAGSSTFADSVGTANGTLVGDAQLDGSELVLDGYNGDFAELPSGLVTNYTQLTVEFWADLGTEETNEFWTRVFSFGDQNSGGGKNSGVDYCHYAGGNYQNLDVLNTNGVDAYANSTPGLDGTTNSHVTVVVDPVNNAMSYYNGATVVSVQHGTVVPLSQMNDTYNLIGRSLYNIDPGLWANIHEFRIYKGAVSQSTVALNDAAGPSQYLTSPGTISSLNFSSPLSTISLNQSVQQSLIGNFALVSNLNLVLYGGVTYTSLNPSVLTISSSGLVKGIALGSGSVVATYGSLSATNTLSVVAPPTTLVHRYSFIGNANDSVGTAHGTLMNGATVSGGQLVLSGGTYPNEPYLSLPGNVINISTSAAVTFEAWATIGSTPQWSHLFEFGANTANNIYCAPRANDQGFDTFGLSEGGGVPGGQTLSWAHGISNTTVHITGVVDPTTSTLAYYTNGVLVVASYSAAAPLTSIYTNNAMLGRSSYGDQGLIANIREFRIYSGALTPAQIAMSDLSGPGSTNWNPGTLQSITVVPTSYPAFSGLVAPVVLANYSSLGSFNILPNVFAKDTNLVVTSSDSTILSVGANNMLTTYRPGIVTLSATYLGKTSSATVEVQNHAVLTHRYSFISDARDSVGGANGTNEGSAYESNGLQLDGGSGDYVALPGGLLSNYQSATMDIWATISTAQQHWARLWEFADVTAPGVQNGQAANELYFAPAWNGGANAAFLSDGVPWGGANLGPQPPAMDTTVHLTCVIGDGILELYTNAVPYLSANITAPASQVGTVGSWVGYSPYGDPGITGTVNEYRIYQGRLSLQEIQASDALGAGQTLSTAPPRLSVSTDPGNVVLTWPAANGGFWVQASSSLSSPHWQTVTNVPTLVGGTNWEVTIPAGGAVQFFRLWR